MPSEQSDDAIEQDGLYQKYTVIKDGEAQRGCFVLKPKTDPAAREAIEAYADATDDEHLEADLREWLKRIPMMSDSV